MVKDIKGTKKGKVMDICIVRIKSYNREKNRW